MLRENRHRYGDLLKEQHGVCALCEKEPTPNRRLDMDHNHQTMVIRGLLCVRCNRSLRDWMTPEWAERLTEYLRKAEANNGS